VKADRSERAAMGDVIGLASSMLVFFNKFKIYLFWKRRPDSTERTSTPRKW
jgi:hypothetical protein